MTKYKKFLSVLLGGVLLATTVLGGAAFLNVFPAQAAGLNQNNVYDQPAFQFGPWLRRLGIDFQQLLADALGISVDKLEDAQEQAHQSALDQAVEKGFLTQKEADLMMARYRLREYIDPQAILAQSLGMSVEELQAAFEEGKTLREMMDEKDLTAAELRQAQQQAYENAIQKAVADGVITQEQADLFLNYRFFGFGLFKGFRGGGRHGGFGFPGGGWEWMPRFAPDAPADEIPAPGF